MARHHYQLDDRVIDLDGQAGTVVAIVGSEHVEILFDYQRPSSIPKIRTEDELIFVRS
jgi:hypothetical protein